MAWTTGLHEWFLPGFSCKAIVFGLVLFQLPFPLVKRMFLTSPSSSQFHPIFYKISSFRVLSLLLVRPFGSFQWATIIGHVVIADPPCSEFSQWSLCVRRSFHFCDWTASIFGWVTIDSSAFIILADYPSLDFGGYSAVLGVTLSVTVSLIC